MYRQIFGISVASAIISASGMEKRGRSRAERRETGARAEAEVLPRAAMCALFETDKKSLEQATRNEHDQDVA
jgi:hypothetical protein